MNQLEEGHLREREAEKQDTIAALEEALAGIEFATNVLMYAKQLWISIMRRRIRVWII
jgi:hypothetical protein